MMHLNQTAAERLSCLHSKFVLKRPLGPTRSLGFLNGAQCTVLHGASELQLPAEAPNRMGTVDPFETPDLLHRSHSEEPEQPFG